MYFLFSSHEAVYYMGRMPEEAQTGEAFQLWE